MYEENYYKEQTKQEIKRNMKEEGFSPLLIKNQPGFVYSHHKHPEAKLLAILEGSIQTTLDDKEFECTTGDRLLIPGNIPHKAVVGENGCRFYWAEKLID